jgi:NAD(P)-dependent dehydrogenase (short-subunit alcohol dehydrogenase family)
MGQLGPMVVAGGDEASVSELAHALRAEQDVIPISPAAEHGRGEGATFDPRRPETVEAALAGVMDELGAPAMLVAAPPAASRRSLSELNRGVWTEVLDGSLTLSMHLCRAAIPRMAESGGGRIVIIVRSADGASADVATACTSASMTGFVRALAAEVGGLGITVNAVVVPGSYVSVAVPAIALLGAPTSGYMTAEVLHPRPLERATL